MCGEVPVRTLSAVCLAAQPVQALARKRGCCAEPKCEATEQSRRLWPHHIQRARQVSLRVRHAPGEAPEHGLVGGQRLGARGRQLIVERHGRRRLHKLHSARAAGAQQNAAGRALARRRRHAQPPALPRVPQESSAALISPPGQLSGTLTS